MCGIAGIIGENINTDLLGKMLKTQGHRGPDNTSISKLNHAILGHNRLSIIDLSSKANQPFQDDSKCYTLVFNGEIYNYLELKTELSESYTFKTASDTEVLLAAYLTWKEKCLDRLNGMFSFAIWDNNSKTLFAARDRFGVKPFYYSLDKFNLVFASEIKTLHSYGIPKKMNKQVWASYLVYGSYGMPDETFWNDISQLPGGYYMRYSQKDGIEIKKWYCFEQAIKKHQKVRTFEEVKKIYSELMADSIRLRFRSDVPVGFNVSGGLDSSALLAFVNQQEKGDKIQAYTFYTDDINYDELPWVEEMISITKNPLTKVLLSSTDVIAKIESIGYLQDEPFGGIPTIAYSNIFEQSRKDGVLVLLDGQGMDEQWAGYDYYLKNNDATVQGVIHSPFRTKVLSKEILDLATKPKYPQPFENDLQNKQYRDLFFTKIPRALRFNDRISMAASTELREPFLDYRLVEFAFAQPLEYKIKNDIQKYLVREIVANDLGDSITYAPKRPLQTPQREWLGNELKDFVEKCLKVLEQSSLKYWFDFEELKKEWKAYLSGDNQSSFHIWQWINLSVLIQKEIL